MVFALGGLIDTPFDISLQNHVFIYEVLLIVQFGFPITSRTLLISRYTRGLLNDLGCSELQRLVHLVGAARLGLEDECYRAGVADARGSPPGLGSPSQSNLNQTYKYKK